MKPAMLKVMLWCWGIWSSELISYLHFFLFRWLSCPKVSLNCCTMKICLCLW